MNESTCVRHEPYASCRQSLSRYINCCESCSFYSAASTAAVHGSRWTGWQPRKQKEAPKPFVSPVSLPAGPSTAHLNARKSKAANQNACGRSVVPLHANLMFVSWLGRDDRFGTRTQESRAPVRSLVGFQACMFFTPDHDGVRSDADTKVYNSDHT